MEKTRFIQYVPGRSKAPRPKAPRLHHKKSRAGCQQCRSRRVKCDEAHPTCGSCQRHDVACVYEDVFKLITIPKPPEASRHATDPGQVVVHPDPQASDIANTDNPESRRKHLLELRLLHHYSTVTSGSLPTATEPRLAEIWRTYVPRLAFEHVALLHSIYSISALQLGLAEFGNRELMDAHGHYMDLAIQRHREDITHISPQVADAVWFTSSLLRVAAFASLQERSIDPYTPPIQWLKIAIRATPVFRAVYDLVKHDPRSEALKVMEEGYAPFDEKTMFKERNWQGLFHLLERTGHIRYRNEPWSDEVQATYEQVVGYLGSVQFAVDARRPPLEIGLRLIAFGSRIPQRFVDLVDERQPRALLILAHFFDMMRGFEEVWFIGKMGRNELCGLRTIMPEDWKGLMK